MITLAPIGFEYFKVNKAQALERIARKTRGTHSAGDLQSEAWLIAIEIARRRNCPLDLSHPAEQDQILGWLYKRFVVFVDGKIKESMDAELGDGEMSWHDRLAAPEGSEPLVEVLELEEERLRLFPSKGFSQFSAYMILLKRCEQSLTKLADYLAISSLTVVRRIKDSSEHADAQPSLFDGVESIDPEFLPRTRWLATLWCKWKGLAVENAVWPRLRKLLGVQQPVMFLDL